MIILININFYISVFDKYIEIEDMIENNTDYALTCSIAIKIMTIYLYCWKRMYCIKKLHWAKQQKEIDAYINVYFKRNSRFTQ